MRTSSNIGELPANWSIAKLSEVTLVNPTLDKSHFADELEVSFVPMPAVQAESGIIDVTAIRKFSEVKKGYTPFLEGDVLFAKITPCMENGKMAIVPAVRNGIGFGSTEFHVLRSLFGISAKYVYYYVSSQSFRRKAEHKMSGAVGQKRVTTPYLTNCEIPLPPENEQLRIAAKIEELFSELDKGIENLKTAREQLKVYRQALLKHAFEGKLTAQWREQNRDQLETAAALLARIQTEREQRYQQQLQQWEQSKSPSIPLFQRGKTTGAASTATIPPTPSTPPFEKGGQGGFKPKAPKLLPPLTAEELAELPELPEGWDWEKNENFLFEVKDGTHDTPRYVSTGIPFVTQKNIRNGKLDLTDTAFISEEDHASFSKRSNVQTGDVIISMIGHGRGQCCIVNTDTVFSIKNVGLFKFFGEFQSNKYLYFYYQSKIGLDLVLVTSKGGAQPFIGLTELRNWPVPICSFAEQRRIVDELESKLSEADQLDQTLTASLQQAEVLRQSILKRAFSGQLVAQDANDEPAAALLARIKAEREANKARSKPLRVRIRP